MHEPHQPGLSEMKSDAPDSDSQPPTSTDSRGADAEIPTHSAPPQDGWSQWVRQGLRASALQPLRAASPGPSVGQMLLIIGICAAFSLGMERLTIVGPANFSMRSWLFGWASSGILLAGVWLLLHLRSQAVPHASPVAAWYLLFSVAVVPIHLIAWVFAIVGAHGEMPQWWMEGRWYAWAIYGAFFVWSAAAAWRIAQAINRSSWIAAAVAIWALVAMGLGSSLLRTQSWESVYAEEEDTGEPETLSLSQAVFETQQTLLDETLAAIEPHAGDGRQVYGIIYAPYSQDVFLRESEMVKKLLEERFGAAGRVVRLVNHPAVTDTVPWATNSNLERSIGALAKAMNIERDIVVLYLTSHGGADFALASQHWPLEVENLTGDQLREALDKAGIKNRVIAVSACYSGGWIEPLQDDNTLIMTAADKDHTSYGCGSKSELTYFGRAVFDEQLRKTRSFEAAFKAAVPVIAQREQDGKKEDGFSNPQISVGERIRAVLQEWEAQSSPESKSVP